MIEGFEDLLSIAPTTAADDRPPGEITLTQATIEGPPTPQGGTPEAPGVESARGVPEMSGTCFQDLQLAPCIEPQDCSYEEPVIVVTGNPPPAAQPPAASLAPLIVVDTEPSLPQTAAELRAFIGTLDLEALTFAQKKELLDVLEAKETWEAENMLERYRPYPKQKEFHAAGASERERLLMAGNQLGKTYSAAAEVAYHLTGLYPWWWAGKRFDQAVRGLAAGVTSQLVRDSMQVLLFGYPAKTLGHGMVPKSCIVGEPTKARSITDAYDTVRVKHVSGGESVLYLRAYEQGREKVQAMTLDFVWLDEEPDADYYTEALTRTNVAFGPVFMTFTPLKGMSATVGRFILEKHGHVTTMTIDDVEHYSAEQKAAIIAQYPAHEREARTKGIPALGSGRIFPLEEESIKCEPFPIPDYWPRLNAIDFGWDHPAGMVFAAWDRDNDVIYIYHAIRARETLIPVQASVLRSKGAWIPVSWPHDGYAVKDAMHGEQLAQQFRNEGVNMREEHAHFEETPTIGERKMSLMSTEAGIQEMLTRMETGRLKVFAPLADWFEEFRLYHRKEGLIVKVRDDLMSSTRLVVMDIRHAEVRPHKGNMIDHNRRSDGLY